VRLLFFILLLVNVAAFAYFSFQEQGVRPNKSALPALNAERIKIVSSGSAAKRDTSAEKLTCWRWRGFKPETLTQARAALEKLALGDKLTQPPSEEYWVYMAPQKNKRDGEKKLAELKALGIEDGSLVEERGKWQFAISFAAFPSEDDAIVRLNQLKEKGVKTAKLVKREVVGQALLIQQADEKLVVALNKLQADFPETTLTPVDCKAP